MIVVDDDTAVRDSLSLMLSLSDFNVQTYASGDDYLARPASEAPDAIVVDMHMPGMSGLELISLMKASGHTAPTLLYSGNMNADIQSDAERLGVNRVLTKPFPGTSFVEAVQALVEGRTE